MAVFPHARTPNEHVVRVIPIGCRDEREQSSVASSQLAEAFDRDIECAEVLKFLRRWRTVLDDVGSKG